MDRQTAALEVFYVFEGRGLQPDNFGVALIKAIYAADASNRTKLSVSYPEYVDAINAYDRRTGSIQDYHSLLHLAFGA